MKYVRFVALLALLLAVAISAQAVDREHLIKQSLCDVRVVYLFDKPETIDWPTLFYLNDRFGCQVDLLTLQSRPVARSRGVELPESGFGLTERWGPRFGLQEIDSIASELYGERRPDVVIAGELGSNQACRDMLLQLENWEPDGGSLFNVAKVYHYSGMSGDTTIPMDAVLLNSFELANRYRSRMLIEIPQLYSWYDFEASLERQTARYRLARSSLRSTSPDTDFLEGLPQLRMLSAIDSLFTPGPRKTTHQEQAERFVSQFRESMREHGQKQVDLVVGGYRELTYLSDPGLVDRVAVAAGFTRYMQEMLEKAERAAMASAGIQYAGRVILRDSPHGPKAKFRLSLSVDGPREVAINKVRFVPYWDTATVILEDQPRTVGAHQSLVREYLVDIPRERLETSLPESLLFVADVVYGEIPIELTRVMYTREKPDMTVKFDPPFFFVPPVAQLDVDRVVSSMAWNLVIEKPRDFAGTVKLNLGTPRGVFAGAYRTEVRLDKGGTLETMRIPFTVSNLFETGIQKSSISLTVEGQEVASDTGIIRIARCPVNDRRSIGFMPDTTGLLEDALRLTDSRFRPLTDRTLEVADLSSYDVIIIGSGAVANYPSFTKIKDRLEEYLRYGGSLVMFGQTDDWPQGALPFSVAPYGPLDGAYETRLSGARLLSQPFDINLNGLEQTLDYGFPIAPAVISPAEDVFTAAGGSVLSVSRLGEGQMIYCGLPLLEGISVLNLQAIHLFSNILNY